MEDKSQDNLRKGADNEKITPCNFQVDYTYKAIKQNPREFQYSSHVQIYTNAIKKKVKIAKITHLFLYV